MISEKNLQNIMVWSFLAVLLVLAVLVIRPIFLAIVLGLILSFIFNPLYKWLFKKTKNKNLSALLICLLAFLIFFLPVWFSISILARQAFDIYSAVQSVDIVSTLKKFFPFLFTTSHITVDFSAAFNNFISHTAQIILEKFTNFIINLPILLLQLFVAFFIFFYALKNNEQIIRYTKEILPFDKKTSEKFFKKAVGITYSIIYGNIVIGLVQGIATGIGLFIVGVDNALFLTIIAIFFAIIPIIGAWLVWIPATIFLLVNGHVGSAIFLSIYGFFFVSTIDNVLRPYIVSKKTKMPNPIALIGMIGGLLVFGLFGLIIGPLVLAYILIIFEFYKDKKFHSLFYKE